MKIKVYRIGNLKPPQIFCMSIKVSWSPWEYFKVFFENLVNFPEDKVRKAKYAEMRADNSIDDVYTLHWHQVASMNSCDFMSVI